MKVFSIKKSVFSLALVALIGIAFSACNPKEPIEYSLNDMQGLWKENGTEHFMRFTTESANDLKAGYLWGYEWDEAEGTEESDLFEPDMYHGNSWFMYRLDGEGWHQINKMNNNWADIPQDYTITTLTSSQFVYYKKGYKNEKQSYTKINETRD